MGVVQSRFTGLWAAGEAKAFADAKARADAVAFVKTCKKYPDFSDPPQIAVATFYFDDPQFLLQDIFLWVVKPTITFAQIDPAIPYTWKKYL